ncbi:MAG TPA: caspase family protein [Candidatus Ozemobacteraceae bacterium]|nr:caspase family protein [Candidatus Ozemobacteraceae bacterium]
MRDFRLPALARICAFIALFLSLSGIAQGARLKALLVGINAYPSSRDRLEGCVNDCLFLKKILIGRYGFRDADIVTLLDAEATGRKILETFAVHLAKGTDPGDTVLFYFCGHGFRVADRDGDEPDGQDESIAPWDYERNGLLTDDLLDRYFATLQGRKFFCVIDSCFSGSANRSLSFSDQPAGLTRVLKAPVLPPSSAENALQPQAFGLEPPAGKGPWPGHVFFGAARDFEPCAECLDVEEAPAGVPSGLFSAMLRSGLKGPADADTNGIITYRELYFYAKNRLNAAGFKQIPQCSPAPEDGTSTILDTPVPGSKRAPEGKPPVVRGTTVSYARICKPYDRAKLNLFLAGGQSALLAGELSRLDFLNFVGPDSTRDLIGLVDRSRRGQRVIFADSAGLEVLKADAQTVEQLASELGKPLKAALLQKSLFDLSVPETPFQVNLRTKGGKTTFRNREKLVYSFAVSHDCYIFIVGISPDGSVNMLFPNPYSGGNHVTAGTYDLPGPSDSFDFQAQPPFGRDVIKAIAVRTEADARRIGLPVKPGAFVSETARSRELIASLSGEIVGIGRGNSGDHPGGIAVADLSYLTIP